MFLIFMTRKKKISRVILVLLLYFRGGVFLLPFFFFEVEGSQCEGGSNFKEKVLLCFRLNHLTCCEAIRIHFAIEHSQVLNKRVTGRHTQRWPLSSANGRNPSPAVQNGHYSDAGHVDPPPPTPTPHFGKTEFQNLQPVKARQVIACIF